MAERFDLEALRPARYGTATFGVNDTSMSGGRDDVIKRFVASDRQTVEKLSKRQRSFSVKAIITDIYDAEGNVIEGYEERRDHLLEVVEEGGPKTLQHPWHDERHDIVCMDWSLGETVASLGVTVVNCDFVVDNGAPEPVKAGDNESDIAAGAERVADATEQSLLGKFKASVASIENQVDAAFKVGDQLVAKVEGAVSKVNVVTDKINKFSTQVSNLTADAAALIAVPQDLSDAIGNMLSTVKGIATTATGNVAALQGMFDYGDDDSDVRGDTFYLTERETNRNVVNTMVQAQALAYAWEAAASIDYGTEDEVTEMEALLEEQFQKVTGDPETDYNVTIAMTELRQSATAFFADAKVSAARVETVNTTETSCRLLAYQYNGSSDLGEAFGDLNDLADYAFVSGDAKIVTGLGSEAS